VFVPFYSLVFPTSSCPWEIVLGYNMIQSKDIKERRCSYHPSYFNIEKTCTGASKQANDSFLVYMLKKKSKTAPALIK
jgi:hypothetical protein